jgi:hypothetical protein
MGWRRSPRGLSDENDAGSGDWTAAEFGVVVIASVEAAADAWRKRRRGKDEGLLVIEL